MPTHEPTMTIPCGHRRWLGGLLVCAAVLPAWARPPTETSRRPPSSPVAEAPVAAARAALKVGTLTLQPCGPAWCGRLARPLDPAGEVPGQIDNHFEFYPQRQAALPNAGTVVAAEGGPGYPSTGTRGAYLALFEPLRADRHLLLVDQRGTGRSQPLVCPALQADPLYQPASVAACGARLGPRAALFGSALAADDLAAVLGALGIDRVDLYGDSYGTFFAQTFAGRHPQRLRSVVLDAAYPVLGGDPWYPEGAAQANLAFDQACARSPGCAALTGSSMDRIRSLLVALRSQPMTGSAPDGDGRLQTVTADARGLAYVIFSSASGPVVYRELDAAARAWATGDTAPLLRLVAENQSSAATAGAGVRPRDFSAALFTAVSCADYAQAYRMSDPPAYRRAQYAAAVAARQALEPALYAPFTIDEFLSMPQDYSVVPLCLPWPQASAAHRAGEPVPPGTVFPVLPVLVLSGEFDTLTPPAQGAQAAALFPQAVQVVVANSFHVTALGDRDRCASDIVRRFVATLAPGDTGCAISVAPVRLLPAFVRSSLQLPLPVAAPGNEGTAADLRAAAAALAAAGDVLARWWVNYDGTGVGLRGGSFSYRSQGSTTRFKLDSLQWTDDVAASGTLDWHAGRGEIRARLRLSRVGTDAAMPTGWLTARWPERGVAATARVEGRIDGRRIAATLPAP
jgi:pimeloyl-ACP methyl ester carboxylesterase